MLYQQNKKKKQLMVYAQKQCCFDVNQCKVQQKQECSFLSMLLFSLSCEAGGQKCVDCPLLPPLLWFFGVSGNTVSALSVREENTNKCAHKSIDHKRSFASLGSKKREGGPRISSISHVLWHHWRQQQLAQQMLFPGSTAERQTVTHTADGV